MSMERFKGFYLDWRSLAERTLSTQVENPGGRERYGGIALTGMGGSGIIGDIIHVLAFELSDVPTVVIKDFSLPKYVKDDWLVLAISYSGNTKETLSTVHEALSRGCDVAGVSSGGKLAEIAREKGLTYLQVESGRVPRASMPALLIGALKVLRVKGMDFPLPSPEGIAKLGDVDEAESLAEYLVEGLTGRIPVFLSDVRHYPLAIRAKNEFNENAKIPAKVEVLPEWGHNDIVGWEKWLGPFTAIVLELGEGDKLLKFAANYLREVNVPVKELVMSDSMPYVDRVLWYSLVLGLASLKLAEVRGVDPGVTESISKYKTFLKSWSPNPEESSR